MKRTRSAILTAAVAALLATGLAACDRDKTAKTNPPTPVTAGNAPPAAPAPTATLPNDTSTNTASTAPADANRTAGEAIGDAAITAKVKTAMLADPEVKGLQVNVDTVNGVVTLTGTVDNQGQADKAAAIANRADGVKSVNNNLTKRG